MPTPKNDPVPEPGDPRYLARRYSKLGTTGVTVSSDPRADVPALTSRLEGWAVAFTLLLASCLAMGIYLVVLHH
jgi:hypothetical protein